MKKAGKQHLRMMILTLLCTLGLGFTAFAAELAGGLSAADANQVTGWAWNTDSYDETVNVEILIYKEGSSEAAKTLTAAAGNYDSQLSQTIGDGYHAFSIPVNWAEIGGSSFRIEGYAVSGAEKTKLADTLVYTINTPIISPSAADADDTSADSQGPGVEKEEEPAAAPAKAAETPGKGASLGMFNTTGYCNCTKCSSGHNLTYSGTVPKANHTISADISIFPIGTKLMINGVVYTVEDIGSGVDGRKLDIYYASHQEALAHGLQKVEVFAVE